jgi:glyoxylase-like metal-dependent hydrolase (beta-lactamase superfamily II)
MRLGELDIVQLIDGQMQSAEPKGVPPKDSPEYEAHKDYITPDGRYLTELGAFLVRTGDRVILIDAGMGPRAEPACCANGAHHAHDHHHGDAHADVINYVMYDEIANAEDSTIEAVRKLLRLSEDADGREVLRKRFEKSRVRYGELGMSLARAGIRPEEVTDVVLSHLHPDHIGWVSRRGESYFTNADIWAHQADIDHFLGPDSPNEAMFKLMFAVDSTKERMAPVMGQLRAWDRDCTIAPGLDLIWTPGHTPGSSVAVLSSGDQRGMLLGDVIHCPLEMVSDDFAIMADIDPALAKKSKERVMRELEDPSMHASSTHFPGLNFGRLLTGEGKRQWVWS